LEVYSDIVKELANNHEINKIGYFVSGRDFYNQVFLPKNQGFEEKNLVIKEWECIQRGLSITEPNLSYIQSFDGIVKNMPIFAACMGDRRIYQGKKVTFSQDYSPSYSSREMLGILEISLQEIEKVFKQISPQFTATLYPATYADILTYVLSVKAKIPHFDLRLSRMKNYVMFGDGILEPSKSIKNTYEKFFQLGKSCPRYQEASEYLRAARQSPIVYEGAVE